MTTELDELISDYRNIKASPYLATRVEAHVASNTSSVLRPFFPGAGALAVLVVGVILAVVLVTTPPDSMQAPEVAQSVPGFSQLAATPVNTASIAPPSFADLRSVNTPALPEKPIL